MICRGRCVQSILKSTDYVFIASTVCRYLTIPNGKFWVWRVLCAARTKVRRNQLFQTLLLKRHVYYETDMWAWQICNLLCLYCCLFGSKNYINNLKQCLFSQNDECIYYSDQEIQHTFCFLIRKRFLHTGRNEAKYICRKIKIFPRVGYTKTPLWWLTIWIFKYQAI